MFRQHIRRSREMKPFRIYFDDSRFADLRNRVENTRWNHSHAGEDWALGTPAGALRDVLKYWVNEYDWRKKEAELNGYPQYLCDINGQQIHFFHIPATTRDGPTVLMCHGWPDSFLRYAKTFPFLKDYNLVVPSMPGFAFSALPAKGYSNNSEVADLWHKLMTEILGYESYFVTGGDMGRGVACYLADRYREEVKGLLLTDVGFAKDIATAPDDTLFPEELRYKEAAAEWTRYDGAYINIQSTKPLSLGYGLNDSPVGMAGWLLEKFHDWSDRERFSMDDLCDNLTLYWMCGCAATSIRMYHGNSFTLPPMGKITQPVGIARFPKDILPVPKSWIERNYNLIQYTEMPHGGHFTAMEAPEPFAGALKEFIEKVLV